MKRIDAIVLAGGLSRRMGEAKLLLPWRGGTVLDATLANVLASDVQHVTVVTGGYRPAIEASLQPYGNQLRTVYNPHFATGEMLSSLKAGLAVLDETVAGCVVMLGDMPLIRPATINRVTASLASHPLAAPVYQGRRGHPVGFGRKIFPLLLNLPPDGAPRDIIRARRDQLHQINVETESVLIDLDTRERYNQWRPPD